MDWLLTTTTTTVAPRPIDSDEFPGNAAAGEDDYGGDKVAILARKDQRHTVLAVVPFPLLLAEQQ